MRSLEKPHEQRNFTLNYFVCRLRQMSDSSWTFATRRANNMAIFCSALTNNFVFIWKIDKCIFIFVPMKLNKILKILLIVIVALFALNLALYTLGMLFTTISSLFEYVFT